jgi:ATP-dependent DNA helicase RecQ
LQSLHYRTSAYHAGLSPFERREIEKSWLGGDLTFVVCTSAFGMGINKPDVRWVVHYQPPALLSEYLQEIGRGGRDGGKMQALTLISEPTGWLDNTDKNQQNFFKSQQERQYQQAWQILPQIPSEGKVEEISREFPDAALILSLLHSLDRLEWLDPFHYRLISGNNSPKITFKPKNEMFSYLYTRRCRWHFLLNAFGFQENAQNFRCGHCDNCRRR